jgi:TDG/mug DNA glycosylase family protein
MPVLPDVLEPGLRLVLCGTGAGRKSAEVGAYYAKPGNRFWPTLHAVGLTPRLLRPLEYRDLLKFGIGLTDIAKEHIGQDATIDLTLVDATALKARISACAPAIMAFTSKNAASLYLGKLTGGIDYGFQQETIGPTRLFVLTSPSGAAGSSWSSEPWRMLARAVADVANGVTSRRARSR